MLRSKNTSGFTLLEIIIVVIIIGVLASLALPRFFKTVEFSKGTEALSNLSTLRQSMQRCFLQTSDFTKCTLNGLDIEDPSTQANRRFEYTLSTLNTGDYVVKAIRNTTDGGSTDTSNYIQLIVNTAGVVSKDGSGIYASIK